MSNRSFPNFKEAAVWAQIKALEDHCVVLIQRQADKFITVIEEIQEQPPEPLPEEKWLVEQIEKDNLNKKLNIIGEQARQRQAMERRTTCLPIEKEPPTLVSGNIIEQSLSHSPS